MLLAAFWAAIRAIRAAVPSEALRVAGPRVDWLVADVERLAVHVDWLVVEWLVVEAVLFCLETKGTSAAASCTGCFAALTKAGCCLLGGGKAGTGNPLFKFSSALICSSVLEASGAGDSAYVLGESAMAGLRSPS
jgi:hypothetical protein